MSEVESNRDEFTSDPEREKRMDEWHDKKIKWMEAALGKQHDIVMHAIFPYAMGGGLDLYYYPNAVSPGTAIATMELSDLPGEGSSNSVFDTYELLMFTRHKLNLDDAKELNTPFGRAHTTINAILNCMAPYSADAELNPGDTCEFPAEMEIVGGKCLIFDAYGLKEERAEFGLLAIIEIHRKEMDFARKNGGAQLIQKLKQAKVYPYSDVDRPSVI